MLNLWREETQLIHFCSYLYNKSEPGLLELGWTECNCQYMTFLTSTKSFDLLSNFSEENQLLDHFFFPLAYWLPVETSLVRSPSALRCDRKQTWHTRSLGWGLEFPFLLPLKNKAGQDWGHQIHPSSHALCNRAEHLPSLNPRSLLLLLESLVSAR